MLKKLGENPRQASSEYFIWSAQGRPVSVHLSFHVINPLKANAGAGLGTLPRRGLEVGGLLLGRVIDLDAGQYAVQIEDIEPFEIEHVRGPSYILSPADREELFRRLRKRSKRGLAVVGYYRSHTRPGLYLDEYDHDMMKSFFAHPSSIALLIRPIHDGEVRAGFFIWEDGEIHRASTYREFPLDADLLQDQQTAERPDASAAAVSPLPAGEPVRPANELVRNAGEPVRNAEPRVPHPITASPSISPLIKKTLTVLAALRESLRDSLRNADRRTLVTRGAIAVGALIFAILLWRGISEPSVDRSHNVLALNAEPTQAGQLRLTWDRNSILVARNQKATLWITDGTEEKEIVLDSQQLRTGVIVYKPVSGDVNFRLQIGDFAESLRAISPRFSEKSPSAVNAQPAPPQTRARDQENPPAASPAPAGPATTTPAGPTTTTPATPPATTAVAPPPTTPKPPVRNPGNGFVPARAIKQFTPTPPRGVKLSEDVSVSVKVTLDESGHVKSTDLVSQNVDSRLANAAMDAARRWRFEPARQNQRRVSTSVVLNFKFNREPNGGG